jgi:hypothetical protein
MKKTEIKYVVVRHYLMPNPVDNNNRLCYNAIVIDSFNTFEAANDKKDEYTQEMVDRKLDGYFRFEVQIITHYNE